MLALVVLVNVVPWIQRPDVQPAGITVTITVRLTVPAWSAGHSEVPPDRGSAVPPDIDPQPPAGPAAARPGFQISHEPESFPGQCRAVAKSTGRRCRNKADETGFCRFHRPK